MKSYPIRTGIIVALAATFALALNAAPKNDTAKVMFEAAKKEEVVNGDLNAAIAQYRSIVLTYKDDRATVADAFIRMAECYQKLGDVESRRIYEHVVNDFADQKEAAAVARARLGNESRMTGFGQAPLGSPAPRKVALPVAAESFIALSPNGRFVSYHPHDTLDLAVCELATGKSWVVAKGSTER